MEQEAPSDSNTPPRRGTRGMRGGETRRLTSSLVAGGLLPGLVLLGLSIATAATLSKPLGGVLLIASWAILVRALHLLGRSGPA